MKIRQTNLLTEKLADRKIVKKIVLTQKKILNIYKDDISSKNCNYKSYFKKRSKYSVFFSGEKLTY